MKKVLDFDKVNVIIELDESPENPRNCGDLNLGQCIFFHKRYNFGDKHEINSNDYSNFDEMKIALIKDFGAIIILPVYMYDHSGQTIQTTPFNSSWDSGQLGFIMTTRKAIQEMYNIKNITKKIRERAENELKSEIETLDMYLRGDVYGFKIEDKETGEEIDSAWGFYGDTADNGIFDYVSGNINTITKEIYVKTFENARWEY